MHFGQYVFTQIASFLPKRYFERLVAQSCDRTKNWMYTLIEKCTTF